MKISSKLNKLKRKFYICMEDHEKISIICTLFPIVIISVVSVLFLMEYLPKDSFTEALKNAVTIMISMIGFSISTYIFLNNTLQRRATDNASEIETIAEFLRHTRKKLGILILFTTTISIINIALVYWVIPQEYIESTITSMTSSTTPRATAQATNSPWNYRDAICVGCILLSVIFIYLIAKFEYSIINYEKGLIETARYQLQKMNNECKKNNEHMDKNKFLVMVNNIEIILERISYNYQNALKQSANDSPILIALRAKYHTDTKDEMRLHGLQTNRENIASEYKKIIEYRNYFIYSEDDCMGVSYEIGYKLSNILNEIFEKCLEGEILSNISLHTLSVSDAKLEKTVFRNCSLQQIDFQGKTILKSADFRDSVLDEVNFEGADCTDINFTNTKMIKVKVNPNTKLTNSIFSGADISGIENLGPTDIRNKYLEIKHANFSFANMINMNICNTKFDYSDMENVKLYNSKIGCDCLHPNNTSFKFVNLKYAIMMRCKIRRSFFKNANLTATSLAYSDMREVDCSECRFDTATLTESKIVECKFNKTYCSNISFKGAKLERCEFNDATMPYADFSDADLNDVKFNGSVCKNSLFVGTKIISSSFKRSIMSNVRIVSNNNEKIEYTNFEYANLNNSAISNVEFKNCKFTGVDLSDSRLINVKFVDCEGIETIHFARAWMDTVYLGTYNNKLLRNTLRYCRNVVVGLSNERLKDKIL